MTTFETGGPPRRGYQKKGLNKMIETGGKTALLFDPGTGKTAVALDYAGLLALKRAGDPDGEVRVLVVCPLVAVDTWVIQAEKFMSPMVNYWAEALGGSLLQRAESLAARGGNPFRRPLTGKPRRSPEAHHRMLHYERSWAWSARGSVHGRDVTITEGPNAVGSPRVVLEVINLDTLVSRQRVGSRTMADVMLDAIKRYDPHMVVVDESHRIKAATGNASRLLARLSPSVKRRLILTGTVMPHSPMDVFGQWRFLDPYAFGDRMPDGSMRQATLSSFRERYATLGGWMGKEIISFKNLDHMQEVMARNAVVARKAEELDLPPTQDIEIPVILGPAESKAYAEMQDSLATMLATGQMASVPNRLSQMMRLRQITSGHLPDDMGNVTYVGSSKVNMIRSLVQDTLAGEKRIVIFSLFSMEIEALCRALVENGTEIMRIEGGTSTMERQRMRQRFGTPVSQLDQRIVMVAQIKTMSLAVNELVTASHAIFGSLSQQRDDYVQARDRLDRIGQTQPVTFWHVIVPGTVDEVILKSHRDRTDLENAMLRHIAQGREAKIKALAAGNPLAEEAIRDVLGMAGF